MGWALLVFSLGSPTEQLAVVTRSPVAVRVVDERRVCVCGGGCAADAAGSGADARRAPPGAAAAAGDAAATPPPPPLVAAPAAAASFCAPAGLLRREVWLANERGETLGHAVSWWRPDAHARLIRGGGGGGASGGGGGGGSGGGRGGDATGNPSSSSSSAAGPAPGATPVGRLLAAARTETFREMLAIEAGHHDALARVFAAADAAVGAGGGGAPPAGGAAPPASPLLWSRAYALWSGGAPAAVIAETFSPALDRWLGPSDVLVT